MKIIFESKSRLNEDRMVKFGNEMYPKFGWCVILMGGAASGKGTAYNFKIPIEGDYYNPDNLKEIERMWNIKSTKTGRPYKDDFDTPEGGREVVYKDILDDDGNVIDTKPVYNKDGTLKTQDKLRNMKNREFVGELHYKMDDLSKRWKKSVYTTPEGVDPQRLPNIIFDITGKKLKSIDEIVSTVKPAGYKVAIVWMLTKAELAIANNASRPRSVDEPILIDTHLKCMDTAEYIFNSGYIDKLDEFWVIDTATDFNPRDFAKEYYKAQNVYKIPCEPEGLKKFDFIAHRILYNKLKFKRELRKLTN